MAASLRVVRLRAFSFLNEAIPQFRPPPGCQVAADRTTVGTRLVKRTAERVVSADAAPLIECVLPADAAAAAIATHHMAALGAGCAAAHVTREHGARLRLTGKTKHDPGRRLLARRAVELFTEVAAQWCWEAEPPCRLPVHGLKCGAVAIIPALSSRGRAIRAVGLVCAAATVAPLGARLADLCVATGTACLVAGGAAWAHGVGVREEARELVAAPAGGRAREVALATEIAPPQPCHVCSVDVALAAHATAAAAARGVLEVGGLLASWAQPLAARHA